MADIERFVSTLDSTVKQNVDGLVSDVKREFSNEELEGLLRRSITRGITQCQLDRNKKAEEVVKKKSSLAKKINELTASIEGTLDCNNLQQRITEHLETWKASIEEGLKETAKQLESILPITKVPLNPFAIPKFIVKQTVGRVLPDLEATIDFIKRTAEVVTALSKLIKTVDDTIDRLEACAVQTVDLISKFPRNAIDEAIDDFKMSVEDAIADAICNSLKEAGIKANNLDDVLTAVKTISNLKDDLEAIKTTATQALSKQVTSIGAKQADIQTLTGIPPVLDTSSLDNFLKSVDSPEYAQYKESVAALTQLPDPVVNTAPVVTGANTVGATLTCSNGTWTANGVANDFLYTFQWVRQGVEIAGANTFQYTTTSTDAGFPIYCRVRAENQISIEEAQSNIITIASPGYTGSAGGYTGSQGIQGPIGYTGSLGATGYTGSFGLTGYTGSLGATGYTGSLGATGYTGSLGATGYVGSQGSVGYVGSQGTFNTGTINGGVTFDSIMLQNTATLTTSSVTTVSLVEYPSATYRSGSFTVQAVSGGESHFTKISTTANSSVVIGTEFGTLITGASLFTVEVDISGGNARLRITPASATSTTFKTYYELVTA